MPNKGKNSIKIGSYVHHTKAESSCRMLKMSDQNSNYSYNYNYSSGVTEILSGFG